MLNSRQTDLNYSSSKKGDEFYYATKSYQNMRFSRTVGQNSRSFQVLTKTLLLSTVKCLNF